MICDELFMIINVLEYVALMMFYDC